MALVAKYDEWDEADVALLCFWFDFCGNAAEGALVLAKGRIVPCCLRCEEFINKGKVKK